MENGTYPAVALQAVIYESPKTGSLICALNHCIVGENDTPTAATIKSYSTLINKDGVVNTRTVDNLKEIFGWDGNDPFWLQENDLASIVHDIVVESEPFTTPSGKSIMTPKVKWINLRGHGAASGMPAPADRRSILAKYGSKFRAVSGGLKPALPPDAPAPVPVPELKFTPPPAQKTLPGLPSPPEPDIADSTQGGNGRTANVRIRGTETLRNRGARRRITPDGKALDHPNLLLGWQTRQFGGELL